MILHCFKTNLRLSILILTAVCYFLVPFNITAESQADGAAPDAEIDALLDRGDLSDEEFRLRLVEAAVIRELSGDLSSAAELYKRASLAVKGRKDFGSLYKAASLRVEIGDYRAAAADIRAVSTFADDIMLRLKALVLSSRLESAMGRTDEAIRIMSDLLSSGGEFPQETLYWAAELKETAEGSGGYESFKKLLADGGEKFRAVYDGIKKMPMPERVFGLHADAGSGSSDGTEGGGNYSMPPTAVDTADKAPVPVQPGDTVTAADTETATAAPEPGSEEAVVAIQIGSFSHPENAADLQKTVARGGFAAEVRKKTVNGKVYSVVVIPVAQKDLQTTIISLKERGYEGYPLY